jgi:hypothetical protein
VSSHRDQYLSVDCLLASSAGDCSSCDGQRGRHGVIEVVGGMGGVETGMEGGSRRRWCGDGGSEARWRGRCDGEGRSRTTDTDDGRRGIVVRRECESWSGRMTANGRLGRRSGERRRIHRETHHLFPQQLFSCLAPDQRSCTWSSVHGDSARRLMRDRRREWSTASRSHNRSSLGRRYRQRPLPHCNTRTDGN